MKERWKRNKSMDNMKGLGDLIGLSHEEMCGRSIRRRVYRCKRCDGYGVLDVEKACSSIS